MKKFLLLAAVAVLFVGCSKETATETMPVEVITSKTAEEKPIPVLLHMSGFRENFMGNYPAIIYSDENWDYGRVEFKQYDYQNEVFYAQGNLVTFVWENIEYSGELPYIHVKIRCDIPQGDFSGMEHTQEYTISPSEGLSVTVPIGRPMHEESGNPFNIYLEISESY